METNTANNEDKIEPSNKELHCLNKIKELMLQGLNEEELFKAMRKYLSSYENRTLAGMVEQPRKSDREYWDAKFRSAFEDAGIGKAMLSLNGQVLQVNQALCEMLGYQHEDLKSFNLLDLVLIDDISKISFHLEELTKGKITTFRSEEQLNHKSNGLIWTNLNASLIRNESNDPLCYIIEVEDISQRRKSETELKRSRKNLKTIFDHTKVGYILLNRDLKILSFNNAIVSIFRPDLEREFSEQEDFLFSFLSGRRHFLTDMLRNVIEFGTSYKYELQRAEGKAYQIEIDAVRGDEGITGACLSTFDITEKKKIELERQQMIAELTRSNLELEKMSQILSHNVRAPLCSILGLTTLINSSKDEEEKFLLIEGLSQSARRLDSIIKELNEMLNAKNAGSEQTSVNLTQLLDEVCQMLPLSKDGGATVVNSNFETVEIISIVRPFLKNIFYNLLSNGVKFASPDRFLQLKVVSSITEGAIQISFADNGVGIDLPKYGDQLFELNKRFHSKTEGFGIGLYLVKTQLDKIGGTIEVKSSENIGSEFIINLPRKKGGI